VVKPERTAIATDIRLALHNRRVILARAVRHDAVIRKALLAHGGNMRILARCRHPLVDADGLDARKIGVEVERGDIVTKVLRLTSPVAANNPCTPRNICS